jgi:hypothetical protein
MRNLLLSFSTLLLLGGAAHAQTLRLNGYGGYTFKDRFNLSGSYNGYSYNNGAINASAHFGGGLEVLVTETKGFEIFYQNQPTTGYLEYGPVKRETPVSANYLMLGGVGYAPFGDRVSGYGGLGIGAGWFTSDFGSGTKFAWGARLGLMINFTESVGIKLGTQLFSPVQGTGGGLYFGTGGVSAGVSPYSTVYQFGFTGGLSFTLPAKS